MPNLLTGTINPQPPATASVGVASSTLVAANTDRVGLVVINAQAGTISLGLKGNPAVLNSGITLLPGGVWVMDDYTYTNEAITGIAYATGSVAVQEFIR